MDDALVRQATDARRALRDGSLSLSRAARAALAEMIERVSFRDRDAFVDELFGLEAPPDDIADLPRGAVPYVPCGVDAILHAVRDAPVTREHVFVDLGAGIGRALLLVHLLTGARTIGVELQRPLVERGRRAVSDLSLANADVELRCADAAETSVSEGDVFFIYASFSPDVLRAVLNSLERIAASKRIVLCAVGFDVHDAPWLVARASKSPELTLYDSSAVTARG